MNSKLMIQTQSISNRAPVLKRNNSSEVLLKVPKKSSSPDKDRYNKYCCGHTTRSRFFSFLLNLQRIVRKIDLRFKISFDEKVVFKSILSAVQSSVDRILLIENSFKTEDIVEFNNFILNLEMKEAKIRNQENIVKINEKEIENIEKLLAEKEERLRKDQEKLNSMMNVLRCEQIENEQIRVKCLRLNKEVEVYRLQEAKNTDFTESPSWTKDSENNLKVVSVQQARQDKLNYLGNNWTERPQFNLHIDQTSSLAVSTPSKGKTLLKDKELELKECILHKTEQELKEHAKKIAAHINEYKIELDIKESDLDHRLLELEYNEKKLKDKHIELKLIEDHLKQAQSEVFAILEVFPFFEEYLGFVLKILKQLTKEKNHISVLFQKISEIQEKFQHGLDDIAKSKEKFERFDLKIVKNDGSCQELKVLADELQEKLKDLLQKEKEIFMIKDKLNLDFENNEKTFNLLQGLKMELENQKITQELKIRNKMEKLKMMKQRLAEVSKLDN